MFIVYNEELKNKFLCHLNNSGSDSVIKKIYNPLFKKTENYEVECNKDIKDFSADELNRLFNNEYKGLNKKTLEIKLSSIKRYTKWCKDNNYTTSVDCVNFKLNDNVTEPDELFVKSPRDLEIKIRTNIPFSFDKTDFISAEIRAFIWFVYTGIRQKDAINLKYDDLHIKEGYIKYNEKYYEIYPEMTSDVMRACKIIKENSIGNDNYLFVNREGNRYQVYNLTRGICLRQRTLRKNEFRISLERIRLSGLFYRTYQREMLGCPPTFSEEIEYHMQQSNHKTNDELKTRRQIKYSLESNYNDYKKLWQKK